MKKRYNLIFVLLLALVLAFTLIACNQTTKPGDLPQHVGENDDTNNNQQENATVSLKFEFPKEMSSIFNSIYADEFDITEYVEYTLVYRDAEGMVVREVPCGFVETDMVDEADRSKLSVPGHHDIHITARLDDNSTVKGSFKLHLKDRSGISLVKYTFDLLDRSPSAGNDPEVATPYFGTVDMLSKTATIGVEKGVTFENWNQFVNAFPMSIESKALALVRTDEMTYSPTQGFPFTVEKDTKFRLEFSKDVIHVSYALNVPGDALLKSDKTDPENLFKDGGKYANETPLRNSGNVRQPADDEINVYHGYTFGGWFDKKTDKLFRFSTTVGAEDIDLYAKWVLTEYSFTVYTMGGDFIKGLTNSTTQEGVELSSIEKATANKFEIVDSTSRFALGTGALNRITFTGFHFNVPYSKYAAKVQINPNGDSVILKFSEIYQPSKANATRTIFEKSGNSLKIDELYTDYQCTEPLVRPNDSLVNDDQPVTYIKWVLNDDGASQEDRIERISNYYKNVAFANGGYSILADGSVRLEQLRDWDVNELVVPAEINVDGAVRKVSAIGERAFANAKAITKLDLSGAKNLTSIGREAFAHAQSLKEIVMPAECNITNIGDNAFIDTEFENHFAKNNGGAEFIVIGKMLYKYVGEDKTIVNLSNPETYYSAEKYPSMTPAQITRFNNELKGVESLEDGAFARCPSLQTLTLSSNITTIRNNVFKGLAHFETLNLTETATASADGKHSKLINIGESAFEGTPFLTIQKNQFNGAVIIGNVYYRFMDTSATRTEIPATYNEYAITHIAPEAFVGCGSLKAVEFGNEAGIVSIGKDAFRDTLYIRGENATEKFTVVNNILTEYYGPTAMATTKNLTVPSNVTTISGYAFGQYSRYFESLLVKSNVSRIENYAFNGSYALEKIILTDIGADTTNKVLTGAPSIGEYAFANANGEMRDNLNLYFNNSVIEMFEGFRTGGTTPTDKITAEWYNLYTMRKSHFIAEAIATVEINPEKIAGTLLKTTAKDGDNDTQPVQAFKDAYGTNAIADALIITSNTNVVRMEPLIFGHNEVKFIPVPEPVDKNNPKGYEVFWEEGKDKYLLSYKYGQVVYAPATAPENFDKDDYFVITVYNAMQGAPKFTDMGAIYDGVYEKDGKIEDANEILYYNPETDQRTYWFEGLDGQVEDQKSGIPVFYTSHKDSDFNILFKYKDIYGNVNTIKPRVSGLDTRVSGNELTANISVDFYGVGTYDFEFKYSVMVSRFKAIRQIKPVNVPVNSINTEWNEPVIELIGEDGITQAIPVIRANFGTMSPLKTDVLGTNSVEISYSRISETVNGQPLTVRVYYTVVLEADASLFEYELCNALKKTVRITGYLGDKKTASNVVIPNKWVDTEGRFGAKDTEYQVAEIGYISGEDSLNGVFADMTSLTAVYLPDTIDCIGVNTFNGCTALQNVYTARQTDGASVNIPVPTVDAQTGALVSDYLKLANTVFADGSERPLSSYKEVIGLGDDAVEWTVVPVELVKLPEITGTDIVIRGVIDDVNKVRYRIVKIAEGLSVGATSANVNLYLPDTVFSAVSFKVSDTDTTPITNIRYHHDYIGNDGAFIVRTENCVPASLTLIGKGAFWKCTALTSIDLSKATNLQFVGAHAFMESGLTSIDFSHNTKYTQIDGQTFFGCVALTEVTLHGEFTAIGKGAFALCSSLTKINGELRKLKFVGIYAFKQARSLLRFDFYNIDALTSSDPESGLLNGVKTGAFTVCSSLTIYCHFDKSEVLDGDDIVIGNSWSDQWNTYNCPIVWNCDSNDVASDGYVYVIGPKGLRYALNESNKTAKIVGQPLTLTGDIDIPATINYKDVDYDVVEISADAFNGNDKITSVTVHDKLTKIGARAFENCTGLITFTIEGTNNIVVIEATAFDGCTHLANRPQAGAN